MIRMSNPPHPGVTLREDILPALGLTVTAAAAQLGITPAAFSRVLNCHTAISPQMALRLEGWLGIDNGVRAELWVERSRYAEPDPGCIPRFILHVRPFVVEEGDSAIFQKDKPA